MLRGRKQDGTVHWADRLVALGLQVYEDGICRGCGQPRTESHSDANVGAYEVHGPICHGCASIDEHKQAHTSKDALPGQKILVRLRQE